MNVVHAPTANALDMKVVGRVSVESSRPAAEFQLFDFSQSDKHLQVPIHRAKAYIRYSMPNDLMHPFGGGVGACFAELL